DDCGAGVREHQRGARVDADQGHSTAARELRRIVAADQPPGNGRASEHLATRIGRCVMAMSLLIAGGGTGGHLYPGIAVAREVIARVPGAQVAFVGTAAGIESRVVPREGFALDTIRSAGLKGKSPGSL